MAYRFAEAGGGDRWQMETIRLQPVNNLSYNYVLSGFQGIQPVILKLSLDTEGLHREAVALKVFADFGAVKVLDEEKGDLLIGRAIPGTSLKDYFLKSDPRSLQIACQVTQKLHQAPFTWRIVSSYP
ncbi:MAG: aminoglycoside phosphotransferase family protein [Alphaproteobacteria bacterium]|nr:aminoglycoside phosphotransferase family protein [Alphaproteobacteria bacterium]